MTHPTTDTDDTQKLTKRETEHVRELERLADGLEEANLLYGSALDGMQPGIDAAAAAVEGYDIDSRMARAEDEIATKATDILQKDVEGFVALEEQLDADDAIEETLLADDETGPSDDMK